MTRFLTDLRRMSTGPSATPQTSRGVLQPILDATPRQTDTTPKRKTPQSAPSSFLAGIKTSLSKVLSISDIKSRLKRRLKLKFLPDDWQAHLILRVLLGYDGILCAGTGYGKSLIFEGLAVLGGKGKVVVIICPLKALEHDQVRHLPIWVVMGGTDCLLRESLGYPSIG